jgi:hypothetical protein
MVEGQNIQRGLVISYRRLAVVLGLFVVVVALAVSLWQFVFTSSAAGIPGIHLGFPNNWAQVSPGELKGAPQNAVAALWRKDKSASVIVLRSGPVPLTAATVTKLERELKGKYPDFVPLRAQYVRTRAGKALVVAYERTKQGKNGELDTVTIIPAGRVSYVLDTTSPAGNVKIDHELQGIIASTRLK